MKHAAPISEVDMEKRERINKRILRGFVALIVSIIIIASCAGGDEPAKTETTPVVTTTAPATTATPAPVTPVTESPTPVESAPVYYSDCTAAREAGAAPLSIGSDGYRPELDRNGDGVACEVS